MKRLIFYLNIMLVVLSSCQSGECDMALSVNSLDSHPGNGQPLQISADVNSVEVNNILKDLFDDKTKSRSSEPEITLIKDIKAEQTMFQTISSKFQI